MMALCNGSLTIPSSASPSNDTLTTHSQISPLDLCRFLPASNLLSSCFNPAFFLLQTCFLPASILLSSCFLPASNLLSSCFNPAFFLLQSCFQVMISNRRCYFNVASS